MMLAPFFCLVQHLVGFIVQLIISNRGRADPAVADAASGAYMLVCQVIAETTLIGSCAAVCGLAFSRPVPEAQIHPLRCGPSRQWKKTPPRCEAPLP